MGASFIRIVKLLIFYIIFYLVLAGFCGLYFFLFLKTLDDREPRWKLGDSLIGDTPALNFWPKSYENVIRYNGSDTQSSVFYIQQLDTLLAPYHPEREKSKYVKDCVLDMRSGKDLVCDFKMLTDLVPCLPQYSYGFDYSSNGPCIFLKLNKIYGWSPEFYHRENVPPEMPYELVQKIREAELANEQYKAWVYCAPVKSSDSENLGPIAYYPQQGFDEKYFPYLNTEGYLSPLVAVHFEKPKRGVSIKIECRTWAKNIGVGDSKSVVRFSLLIE